MEAGGSSPEDLRTVPAAELVVNGDPAAANAELVLAALPEGAYCANCGYDLRGSLSPRCPECGFDLTPIRTGISELPWMQRRRIGRLRAYWQTVEFVLRKPALLCREAVLPVSDADAQWFRAVTWLHIAVAVVGFTTAVVIAEAPSVNPAQAWAAGAIVFVLLGLFALAPGVAGFFFRLRAWPLERRERAATLSCYVWGPLSLLLVLMPLAVALVWLDPVHSDVQASFTIALVLIAILVAGTALLGFELRLITLWRTVLRRSWPATLLRLVLLHVSLVLLAVLLASVPAGVFYLVLVWNSLR